MSLNSGFVITSTKGEIFRLVAKNFSSAIAKMENEHNICEDDIQNIEQTAKVSSLSL